jgi:hypothetical protein
VRQSRGLVDLTIIDAPALLEYADCVPLLPVVDGVIVVADAGATRRSELAELTDVLQSTNATVVGCVLNRDGSRVVSRRARRALRRMAGDGRPSRRRDVPPGAAPPADPATSPGAGNRDDWVGYRSDGAAQPEVDSDIGWPDTSPAPAEPRASQRPRRRSS